MNKCPHAKICKECEGRGDEIVLNGHETVAKMFGNANERWACPLPAPLVVTRINVGKTLTKP